MRRRFRDNGLSIVMFGLFFLFWGAQSVAGWRHFNEEQREHRQPEVAWSAYLKSGDFLESTFENWESEFFQMAAFLILSAMLVQRGAAESKKPPGEDTEREAEDDAEGPIPKDAPAIVHRGGLALALYKRSLSLVLASLFVFSFLAHWLAGRAKHNEEAALHGGRLLSPGEYFTSSAFWFESLQNWQSEFLSVGVLVVLSIFLRQSGSPESKPVTAPHAQTGT